jgi:hypothetical protein
MERDIGPIEFLFWHLSLFFHNWGFHLKLTHCFYVVLEASLMR